jgi:hypothetical protein
VIFSVLILAPFTGKDFRFIRRFLYGEYSTYYYGSRFSSVENATDAYRTSLEAKMEALGGLAISIAVFAINSFSFSVCERVCVFFSCLFLFLTIRLHDQLLGKLPSE